MSWTSGGSYSPAMARKSTGSSGVSLGSTPSAVEEGAGGGPVRTTDQADDDVVIPVVLWDGPPRIEVSCVHVLYLPMSQPGQNSSALIDRWPSLASFVQQWSSSSHLSSFRSLNSTHSMINLRRVLSRQRNKRGSLSPRERAAIVQTIGGSRGGESGAGADLLDDVDFEFVDDGDLGEGDDELYQLCVFAGTVDGTIVFWLLEQEIVVQVNLLVHPTRPDAATSPVQSVISGIDEWGQNNMVSVTRDGAVARWELPNGACVRAEPTLARQLAPVKGMEMFCNNRYAIVYGEQSRMMVLDTWKWCCCTAWIHRKSK
ncbi:hypothetical protein PINS_up008542 [Pythium insidiosum]|nr:hypothetical protein PINS_up008542 [Pythium insidiosum]